MQMPTLKNWRRKLALGVAGLATGASLVAAAWPTSDSGPSSVGPVAWNLPTAAAVDGRESARDMMRALRTPTGLVCDHDGCIRRGDAIACAMYAPGHRPRKNGEDTPNIGDSDEFTIADPSWKWPQPGGLGTPAAISYSYSNLLDGNLSGVTPLQLEQAVEEALSVWAAEAPLVFTEVTDSGPMPSAADTPYPAGTTPNLRFGHHIFDGQSGVLAHAYYPSSPSSGLPGDLHFDDSENWAMTPGSGQIDFLEVCVHEIGHAIGLGHEDPPPQAIMNPFYGSRFSGLGTAFLLQDDIDGITALYVTGTGSGCFIEQLVQKTKQSAKKTLPKRLFGAVDQPTPLYKDLRNFRDTVLQRTDVGRQLVAAYYKHGREVFAALAERPELATDALTLVIELQSHLVKDGRAQPNVALPEATYNRGIAWLDRVESLVSAEAREAIVSARTSLGSITHGLGRTVTIRFEEAGR